MAGESSIKRQYQLKSEDLFELSVTGLLLISRSGKILKANEAVRKLFAGKPDLEGIQIQRLFSTDPPFDLTDFLGTLPTNTVSSDQILMLGIDKKNSFWASVHFTCLSYQQDEECVYLCQIQNVSDVKQATDEINYQNHLLHELINSIPDNIFVKDKDSRFLLANRSVSFLMGACSVSELIGKTDFDFYPKKLAQKYRNDEIRIMNSGKPMINIVEQVIDQEHNRHYYSTTKTPLYDSSGKVIGIMGIGRDITDMVKEKKALRKAKLAAEKADHLKSAFLANLSHEVRTPLNGILGFSQFLKKSFTNDPKTSKYLEYIIRNGKRLLHLISDIVDLSKIESDQLTLNFKDFSLYDVVRKQGQVLRLTLDEDDKKQVETYLDVDESNREFILYNDDQRIEQIMFHLLSNAAKFTEKGSIHYGYSLAGKYVKLFVRDTGIGIKEKEIPHIFERFVQIDNTLARQYEGAGLGLTIVHGLVTLLNGSVEVKSAPGKGSEFLVSIPIDHPS